MLSSFKYTEKELKELLNSIGILVDTREKKNKHITDFFDKKGIKYKKVKLHQGDYSFYIPENRDLCVFRDMHFDGEFAIERKASLEELSTNFTKGRDRIKHEFGQHKGYLLLLIENACYGDIMSGNYNSQYNKGSYIATLHSMCHEFDIPFMFLDCNSQTAYFIYQHCYYYLRNLLK